MNDILLTPIRLSELETLIQNSVRKALNESQKSDLINPQSDHLLTIKQAAEFLNLSVPTIYGYVHRMEIPVCKKSKRLYFSKQELIDWIKTGRKKTSAEIAAEADTFIANRRRKTQ